MSDKIEWYCEFTLKNIPEPSEDAMDIAVQTSEGVVSYDATACELHGVFRLDTERGAALVVSEALGRVLEVLSWTRDNSLTSSRHYMKDFRVRPADEVPVDPDVQRYVDKMFGKDR